MKRIIVLLMFIAGVVSTNLYPQGISHNYCIAYYWYNYGHGNSEGIGITEVIPSGMVNIDNGSGKQEKIKCESCVKFIEDMKRKGWVLIQTNFVSTGKRELPVLYMLFKR